jgi:hypothetical protein
MRPSEPPEHPETRVAGHSWHGVPGGLSCWFYLERELGRLAAHGARISVLSVQDFGAVGREFGVVLEQGGGDLPVNTRIDSPFEEA